MRLPRRALVSACCQAKPRPALARGVEVVRVDRSSATTGTSRCSTASTCSSRARACRASTELVEEARPRGQPGLERGRARLPAPPERPLVGVTGTNGKTTTVELLGAIFRAGRRSMSPSPATRPAADRGRGRGRARTLVVCELSSFQLEDVHGSRADVAVLLNLEPDHLDRHGTFEALPRREAARLRARRRGGRPGGRRPARNVEFSAEEPLPAEPRIPGAPQPRERRRRHARPRGRRPRGGDRRGARSFSGVEHRLEPIASAAASAG